MLHRWLRRRPRRTRNSTIVAMPIRRALEAMAAADARVCAVVSDSVSSTKLKSFSQKFPERFVNVGIAEQNLVGVAAGLANGGMIPYVCAASCFLTARAMEQVKVDLGLFEVECEILRHVVRDGVRRTGTDASLDRRPGLDADYSQSCGSRSGRSDGDRGGDALLAGT